MKTFTVLGNCQAAPLADILMRQPSFAAHYQYIKMPKPAYMLQQADYESVKNVLEQIDLFIHQDISNAFGPRFNTSHLKTLMKPGSETISFPSIYFTGYHPEICYLRHIDKKANEFSDYHDQNLIQRYIEQPETAYEKSNKAINDPTYYSEQFINKNAADSLTELKRREEKLDIRLSDFIEQHWKEELLFFSMNHPSRTVLNELTRRVITKLSLEENAIIGKFQHLNESSLPIYASVLKHIKVKNCYDLKIKNVPISIEKYISNHLAIYQQLKVCDLNDNIIKLNNTLPSD
ncbi:WcbI family polysaccharide biosynthesis putative acetyltransferase [Shewanella goraebulensis]|uniref:WcbI family polysaccharide biosynthesis putative acetyltransferase n=1 Tax=Shewanella goraebulensis TaxID=3050637 RepID=UPI002551687F|nr:WcbI family polysaccharide biosynthesis putative acetyltransferase [Shewanella goraebulensis]